MGIEGVNSRISDIQSRILALQGRAAVASQTTTTSSSSSGVTGGGDTFASYLQNAVQKTAAPKASYSLNADGIPTELAAFGNGRIPDSSLAQVGNTTFKMWTPAAQSLTKMIDDAKAQGVTIGVNETYRPYAEQVDLARTKGLYSQGGLAAKPGTSEHGWGMATDLHLDSSALAWMRQNADKYGFKNTVSRESWHWAYRPPAAA